MFVLMARRSWIPAFLLVSTVLLFLLCLATGTVAVPVVDVCTALFSGEAGDPTWVTIVREVRLPEALTALLAGAGLAAGGAH